MLPRKTGKPIAFKCTEELRKETEMFADDCQETLSDYARKAVEERNARYRKNVEIGNQAIQMAVEERNAHFVNCKPISSEMAESAAYHVAKTLVEPKNKPTIPEPKEKMCNPLMKGGK